MAYPLVTVVTAGFNAAKYLLDAIYSVLHQTYTNIEYIYVDDGSDDGSIELIKQNIHDNRFSLLENKKNIGPFKSLNRGMAKAKGKYIAILDADDICLPFRLEKQVNALEGNINAYICGTGIQIINEVGTLQKIVELDCGDFECKYKMQFNNIVAHSSVMYRAKAFNNGVFYSGQYGISEDYEILLRLLEFNEIVVIQTPCILYRITPSGITRTRKDEMDKAQFDIVKKHYSFYHCLDITPSMYINIIEKPKSFKYLLLILKIRVNIYKNITKNSKVMANRRIFYKNQLEVTIKVIKYSLAKCRHGIGKIIRGIYFSIWNCFDCFFS